MSDNQDGTFKGTTQQQASGEGTLKGTFLTDDSKWATLRDRMFVMVAIAAIVAMGFTSYLTIRTNAAVTELNTSQVELVQAQNDAQICAQHDIVLAVRSIGRKLGLPVEDIAVPNIEGLECP